ncbi:MAG TPA: DUF6250 domain-containing protein, partial [Opitutaceae bacterium]
AFATRRGTLQHARMLRRHALSAAFALAAWVHLPGCSAETELHRDEFSGALSRWVVEQMPGGTVTVREGALEIEDAEGCTVWFREKLTAPFVITYETTFLAAGGPHDRVSDMNCFWLAADPGAPDGCPFAPGHGRSGRFADYDSLRTYYVGYGGNENSTTRFRRYGGDGSKPLLAGHDLSDKKFMLEAHKPYQVRIEAHPDGRVRYLRDGEVVFAWRDPAPLTSGWFGFRTVKSHQRIRNFRVLQP